MILMMVRSFSASLLSLLLHYGMFEAYAPLLNLKAYNFFKQSWFSVSSWFVDDDKLHYRQLIRAWLDALIHSCHLVVLHRHCCNTLSSFCLLLHPDSSQKPSPTLLHPRALSHLFHLHLLKLSNPVLFLVSSLSLPSGSWG